MRIVSGSFRGRTLTTPPGEGTRPTSDRARQAIFNILEHAAWAPDLAMARVIDLFAGSGALGFEALSRGAAFCLFVENDEAARGAIRQNVDGLNLFGKTRIHRRDATDLGTRPGGDGPAFGLAFVDPPYSKGLGELALKGLAEGGWLTPEAIVVLERATSEPPVSVPDFEVLDVRDYGVARVHFLRWSGPAKGA